MRNAQGVAMLRRSYGTAFKADGTKLKYHEYNLVSWDHSRGSVVDTQDATLFHVLPDDWHQSNFEGSNKEQTATAKGTTNTVMSPFAQLIDGLTVYQSRPGSSSNAWLAALANDLLSVRPDVFEVLQAHGFLLGIHANQFDHELTAAEMEALRLQLTKLVGPLRPRRSFKQAAPLKESIAALLVQESIAALLVRDAIVALVPTAFGICAVWMIYGLSAIIGPYNTKVLRMAATSWVTQICLIRMFSVRSLRTLMFFVCIPVLVCIWTHALL